MAVVDNSRGEVTLKVVYYGPPAAGKTANLQLISPLIGNESGRLTPRLVGENRVVSVEFPAGSLGRLNGLSIAVRLETIQGDVPSVGEGWSPMLADADGIVFVADSAPHARTDNVKALKAVRERLEGRGRSAATIPVVIQWNKRDRADARPVAELEMELNHRCFPSIEASSSRGTGVAETLVEILKRTIIAVHRSAGTAAPAESEIGQTLSASIKRLSLAAREASTQRFGATIERQSAPWPQNEAVFSPEPTGEGTSESRMLAALERATSGLHDESLSGLPLGLMAGLLAGCIRSRGSLLLFRQETQRMEEREVVPAGDDPLNAPQLRSGGLTAATLCSGHEPQFIADLAAEIFLDSIVPGTEHLRSALIVPLSFGSVTFGGMVVYVTDSEHAPTAPEQAYWKTAANLTSVYLAWHAAKNPAVVSRRREWRRDVTAADSPAPQS
jgi:hypothetical protein